MISDFGWSLRKAYEAMAWLPCCQVTNLVASPGAGGAAKQQCSTGPGQCLMLQHCQLSDTLRLFNIAMEHGPFIGDKSKDFSNDDLALALKKCDLH